MICQLNKSALVYKLNYLFVDPVESGGLVAEDLLGLEPQRNLLLGGLDRVGAVADIATNINGKVTTNGAGLGSQGVGGTEDGAASLDDVLTLPDGGDNGAGAHVLEQTREEGLLLQVGVVLTEQLLAGLGHLQGDKLVATLLEAADDGGDEAALNAVRLDHDEGLLGSHFCKVEKKAEVERLICLGSDFELPGKLPLARGGSCLEQATSARNNRQPGDRGCTVGYRELGIVFPSDYLTVGVGNLSKCKAKFACWESGVDLNSSDKSTQVANVINNTCTLLDPAAHVRGVKIKSIVSSMLRPESKLVSSQRKISCCLQMRHAVNKH